MGAIAAIQSGSIDELKSLLAADARAADECNEGGVPAVLFALYMQRREMAEMLVEAGAKVDAFIAAAMGLTARLRALSDADPALVAARTPDGWTALHLAAFFAQPETARLLLERGADPLARSENSLANLPLHAAAAARQAAIVEMLLDAGTPVDARQNGGYTALHSAAQNKDAATLDILLARGGSMDAASDDGKTPADLLSV